MLNRQTVCEISPLGDDTSMVEKIFRINRQVLTMKQTSKRVRRWRVVITKMVSC